MTGTVDRIRGKGAFCFLKTPSQIQYFAHKKSFREPEAMTPGQRVTFEPIETPQGWAAMNVTKAAT